MKEGYLILNAAGGSFGQFCLVPEEIWQALQEESLDSLSEETLQSLYCGDIHDSIEDIKEELSNSFQSDGQEFACLLSNLKYYNKLPPTMFVFDSPTRMVNYVQEHNIKILGDTF